MRGWIRVTLLVLSLGFLTLPVVIWINHSRGRAVVANNALDAAILENEIRTVLPVGSPRAAVEARP